MSASEFIIVAAIVIIGLIFLVVGQRFIFGSQEETIQYSNQAEAEGLVSLLNRVVTEPASHVSYFQYISLSNITIKDSTLTYEREGSKYSFQVPKNVSDVYLEETTSICVIKTDEKIMVSEKCPKCNLDSVCTLDECKESCPDCLGPKKTCIGDGFCNLNIGENCESSPSDCKCDSGKICCPGSPDSDGNGCSLTKDLKKMGEQCWCNSQCDSGLNCNPTKSGFINYKKACCDSEKQWNGNDCVSPKVYHLVFVPIGYGSDFASFKNDAEKSFDFFLQKIPLKECSDERDRIEAHIIEPGKTPECQISSCSDICSDCNSKALACANSIPELKGKINKVAALCKGSTCPGACGCANGVPGSASSSNMQVCRGAMYEIPSHEIGHTMGLGHVDCDVACHACPPYANDCNCQDCSQPAAEKRLFIMDYCPPFEKYGPAAYQCLKDNEFKDYMC